MGKTGLLLCVCQGTCPSFHKMDVFEVLNALRRENTFDFVALHPQLCADDGEEYLKTLTKNHEIDKLYVAGCDPKMQSKMYRDAFEESEFPREKHAGVDIRNMTTKEAIKAIKDLKKTN
ncbi:heterodisulfide reductase subunit A-like protein [Athalassotoga saccharophila]|uniref:heterodisulfide reductase subunit A-like protein n=1 Tax=Athalassotoga saccharophila TaxID=1441386 RepID=UPI0013797E05|nr:heterodisulfide reductase subunit A-like protein [Athalassotoga saccharophila]BBJ29038.1 heterodisulfide reductase subunit A-like protein [Athalassotoga saccharophila]